MWIDLESALFRVQSESPRNQLRCSDFSKNSWGPRFSWPDSKSPGPSRIVGPSLASSSHPLMTMLSHNLGRGHLAFLGSEGATRTPVRWIYARGSSRSIHTSEKQETSCLGSTSWVENRDLLRVRFYLGWVSLTPRLRSKLWLY